MAAPRGGFSFFFLGAKNMEAKGMFVHTYLRV